MKQFDPNSFLTDLSHNLNNLNPEAGEVNTLSDEFVKVFNDILDKHAPYRYASRKVQRALTNHGSPKTLTSTAKENTLYSRGLKLLRGPNEDL